MEEDAQVGWLRLGRKSKSELSENDLHNYFDEQMKQGVACPNNSCDCLAILANANARASVVSIYVGLKRNQNTNRTRSFLGGSSICPSCQRGKGSPG